MHPKHLNMLKNGASDFKGSKKASSLRDVLVAATALTTLTEPELDISQDQAIEPNSSVETIPEETDVNDEPSCNDESQTEGTDDATDGDGDKKSYQPTRTFPEKLMVMLSQENVGHAICWHPDGKSFAIVNPKKLTADVLPRFFKQAKFESFVRKLYRWGFRQAEKQEAGQMTFYHKNFQKGKLKLALSKLRSNTPSKNTGMAMKRAAGDVVSHANAGPLGGIGLAPQAASAAVADKLLELNLLAGTRAAAMPPLGGHHPLLAGGLPALPNNGALQEAERRHLLNTLLASDYDHQLRLAAAKRELEVQALLGGLSQRAPPSSAVLNGMKSSLLFPQVSNPEPRTYGQSVVRDAIHALRNSSA